MSSTFAAVFAFNVGCQFVCFGAAAALSNEKEGNGSAEQGLNMSLAAKLMTLKVFDFREVNCFQNS